MSKVGGQLVVVKMGAEWCPPCRKLATILEVLSKQKTEVIFISVDVDKIEPPFSDVAGIPDTRFVKNG